MATISTMTTTDFEKDVLQSSVPVLVDFWATWCGPCKAIMPIVEEVASEMDGKAKIVKVNVDEEGELAMKHGIMSIPALVLFKGGQEVDRITGGVPKKNILEMIQRHL